MSRIRTIKPDLLKHERLFDAELETGLPLRIAWAGLPTVCDREGRFEWRPRRLKTDVLPYDDLDFSRVLDAFVTRGMVVKYRVGDEWFGCIPTFRKHQVVNPRESDSQLPSPDQADEIVGQKHEHGHASATRQPREGDATGTGEDKKREEGEQEGKGTEGKKSTSSGKHLFDIWYRAYPNKKAPGRARKSWDKIKPDRQQTARMIRALRMQIRWRAAKERAGEFVPEWKYPATWLNDECWNDSLEWPKPEKANGKASNRDRPKSAVQRSRDGIRRYFEQQGQLE